MYILYLQMARISPLTKPNKLAVSELNVEFELCMTTLMFTFSVANHLSSWWA